MSAGQQNITFPISMLAELRAEAWRQDRTVSWLIRRAWEMSRERIRTVPQATPVRRRRHDS